MRAALASVRTCKAQPAAPRTAATMGIRMSLFGTFTTSGRLRRPRDHELGVRAPPNRPNVSGGVQLTRRHARDSSLESRPEAAGAQAGGPAGIRGDGL